MGFGSNSSPQPSSAPASAQNFAPQPQPQVPPATPQPVVPEAQPSPQVPSAPPQPAPQVPAAPPQPVVPQAPSEPPQFLRGHVGRGKYNIGILGLSGVGKSSLLKAVLGADLVVGSVETTMEPTPFRLPLTDPRGHFAKFIDQLPVIHQDCVRGRLEDVLLWDLPGAGTPTHPASTYVQSNGLEWFDLVVVLVGERVFEWDLTFLGTLSRTKRIVARSKLDHALTSVLRQERNRRGSLTAEEKMELGLNEMDHIRGAMVQTIQSVVADFEQLYLVMAPDQADDEGIAWGTATELNELQLAIDRMFLSIILDRHRHDLSCYFDQSLYGRAGRAAWNWTYEFIRFFKRDRAPRVNGAVCPRTFETSCYRAFYHDSAIAAPRDGPEAGRLCTEFLRQYAIWQGKPAQAAVVLQTAIVEEVNRLNVDILENGARPPAGLEYMQVLAGQFWSSPQTAGLGKELCSCLNQVLRADEGPALKAAVRLSAWLNRLCVTERGSANPVPWPETYTTYRGTYMPPSALDFFIPQPHVLGYRSPMFLATSFDERVARNFLRRSEQDNVGKCPVQFNFELDRTNMCNHENFIEFVTSVPGERELLYTAYSAFKVLERRLPRNGARSASWHDPWIVRLSVYPDNRAVPEDVPVPAWH